MKRASVLILIIICVLTAASEAAAQSRLRRVAARLERRMRTDTAAVVRAYADSLLAFSARYDSAAIGRPDTLDGRLMPLFSPLTFYHNLSKKAFAPTDSTADAASEAVSTALLTAYLSRPDLVADSERRQQKTSKIRKDVDRPLRQDIQLSQRIAPKQDEPEPSAPVNIVLRRPNFWQTSGETYFQFLQNYVSDNWYAGGESNYSMVGSIVFSANYNNKTKLKFDNKLEMKLGFQTSQGDSLHKFKTNNDLIRYTGKLGIQATKRWYYTMQLLAYTQFAKGLKSNSDKVYSDFMSPFNLNLGLGLDYQVKTKSNKLTGSVNLSFLSFNFRYVGRLDLASANGISGDHHTMEDFGSQLTCDVTWTPSPVFHWRSRLYGYTSYKRSQVEWENTLTFVMNRYISANVFVYPRFDDSRKRDPDLGYFQFKEYCSVGFNYKL